MLWTCEIHYAKHTIFNAKTEIFPVTQEQKLGARGHWVLLEHSPVVSDT